MKPYKCNCGGKTNVRKTEAEVFAKAPYFVMCERCGKTSLNWPSADNAVRNWNCKPIKGE